MSGLAQRKERYLRALGLAPMRLRRPEPVDGEPPPAPAATPGIALWLWCPPASGDPFAGPEARLLRHLLHALDLQPARVARCTPEAAGDDRPVLALGPGAPAGSHVLPELGALRDPLQKRIAWPVLRALRRRLRTAGA